MTDSTEAKADGDNVNWEVSRVDDGFGYFLVLDSNLFPLSSSIIFDYMFSERLTRCRFDLHLHCTDW